jgi:photosystem II stability/assembly factor-like uncharacterized protein
VDLAQQKSQLFAIQTIDFINHSFYVSSDQGSHWVKRHDFTTHEQSPTAAPRLVTYKGRLFFITFGGIELSDDNGNSWRKLPTPPQSVITDFAQIDSRLVLAMVNVSAGLYISDDTGQRWTHVQSAAEGFLNLARLGVSPTGTLLVANTDGWLFRSLDRGLTWNKVSLPYDEPSFHATAWAFYFDSDKVGHVYYSQGMGLFESKDDGATWSTAIPLSDFHGVHGVIGVSKHLYAFGYHKQVAGKPESEVYASTDGGSSWHVLISGVTVPFQLHLDFLVIGSRAIVAPDVGVYSTGDFRAFAPADAGMSRNPP